MASAGLKNAARKKQERLNDPDSGEWDVGASYDLLMKCWVHNRHASVSKSPDRRYGTRQLSNYEVGHEINEYLKYSWMVPRCIGIDTVGDHLLYFGIKEVELMRKKLEDKLGISLECTPQTLYRKKGVFIAKNRQHLRQQIHELKKRNKGRARREIRGRIRNELNRAQKAMSSKGNFVSISLRVRGTKVDAVGIAASHGNDITSVKHLTVNYGARTMFDLVNNIEDFAYGTTATINIHQLQRLLKWYIDNHDFIISCSHRGLIERMKAGGLSELTALMKEKHKFEVTNLDSSITGCPPRDLTAIVQAYGFPEVNLHNAGNEAVMCLMTFMAIAQNRLFPSGYRQPNKGAYMADNIFQQNTRRSNDAVYAPSYPVITPPAPAPANDVSPAIYSSATVTYSTPSNSSEVVVDGAPSVDKGYVKPEVPSAQPSSRPNSRPNSAQGAQNAKESDEAEALRKLTLDTKGRVVA